MASRGISGTRRTFKELVDGTLRVQIDVDPECRKDFLRLFPEIDTRVAIAPLKAKVESDGDGAQKGGELARLAGILCGDADFQAWVEVRFPQAAERVPVMSVGPDLAAHIVRDVCGVESRAQLDHNKDAAAKFHSEIRQPWLERKE